MFSELRRIRDRAPDRIAVRAGRPDGGWTDTTWRELCADSVRAAARAEELPRSRPVIVVLDGTAASIATVLGIVEAGVDVVLLEEKTSYLDDVRSPLDAVGALMVIGPPALVVTAARYGTCMPYDAFRSPADEDRVFPRRDGHILQLTSGSTGEPRVARQTLPGVLEGAYAYRELFEFTADDHVLVPVPLAHSYGICGLFVALTAGATLLTLPRFSIRALVKALDDGATALLGTPMLYRLVSQVLAARPEPVRLRVALSAGGPMPVEVAERAARTLGTRVRLIYGITEVGLVACVPRSARAWPLGSSGFAAPGVTLRVIPTPDADGSDPEGVSTGRLWVRTRAMFAGYVGDDRPYLSEDGFYDTGDVVRLDAAGHLSVLGRKESFINVGGRKVNPRRLERVLGEHAAVREVLVFGVERADGEEEIHAALVLDPGSRIDEVLAYCRTSRLRPYEVPHHVHVLDRMPRTGMGKVDRQEVLAATRRPAAVTTERATAHP